MRSETIGNCVLYHGDCCALLHDVSDVGIVLMDPPYGISYESGHATDELWRGGRKIANDSDTGVRDHVIAWATSHKFPCLVFGSRRAPLPEGCRMVLVWDKGAALGMGALDLPWKPSSEEIYVIGKGFAGRRDESNVLYCPPVQSMAKNGRLHPNQKPVELLARLLRKCPLGTVFDPFMGSGSSGEAAIKIGRRFVGVELEQSYFDLACKRLEQIQRQQEMFESETDA